MRLNPVAEAWRSYLGARNGRLPGLLAACVLKYHTSGTRMSRPDQKYVIDSAVLQEALWGAGLYVEEGIYNGILQFSAWSLLAKGPDMSSILILGDLSTNRDLP